MEQQLLQLKQAYINVQQDLEKLESMNLPTDKLEEKLIALEKEISDLRAQLNE